VVGRSPTAGEEHMRKPIAYIKDREIAYMLGAKQAGATSWKTNLGLVPEEGDVPLYEGKDWVGLTDHDIHQIRQQGAHSVSDKEFRMIEAKLKEKNHVS